jgi:copper transport protein
VNERPVTAGALSHSARSSKEKEVNRSLRLGVALLAILGMMAHLPGTASAHADYQSSVPAAGARLAAAPSRVTIVFTEAFVPAQSSAHVLGPGGSRVDNNDAKPDPTDPDRTTMVLTLKSGLGNGAYTVYWDTVSADDGDEANDTFMFTVAAPAAAAPPAAAPATAPAPPARPAPSGPVNVAALVANAVTKALGIR